MIQHYIRQVFWYERDEEGIAKLEQRFREEPIRAAWKDNPPAMPTLKKTGELISVEYQQEQRGMVISPQGRVLSEQLVAPRWKALVFCHDDGSIREMDPTTLLGERAWTKENR